jgi:hypothetical protein
LMLCMCWQEASRERQKILGSMVLQEEEDSKLAKKFADKSAANLLGSMNIKMTSRIKPVVKYELIDTGRVAQDCQEPCDEIQDKGGEGEIPVPVPDEDYEEVVAEIVQRPENQPVDDCDDVAAGVVHEHTGVANDDHQGGVAIQPEFNIPAEPFSSGTGPLYKYLRSEFLNAQMCLVTDNMWISNEDISGELEDNVVAIYNFLALEACGKFIDEESCK